MLMLVNSLALKIYSVTVLCTGPDKSRVSAGYIGITTSLSFGGAETSSGGASGTDNNVRVSYSSAASSSSYGSGDDFDSLGDVLVWGKGVGHSISAHASNISGNLHDSSSDVYSPKALESAFLLDIGSIACGSKRLVLVTKQGEIYSWGEELGGRLGHGVDVYHPKLISNPSGITIESVSCGDFHTCAVFFCGDLYTWGDGTHYSGVLGHGNDTAHWIPKKVYGPLEGLHASSVSCGPWCTAVMTSLGQLFTFGDECLVLWAMEIAYARSHEHPKGSELSERSAHSTCSLWRLAHCSYC
jgi:hypothetical protein